MEMEVPVITPSSSESHSDVSVRIPSVHSECPSSSQDESVVEAAKGVLVSSASLTSREASKSISLQYMILGNSNILELISKASLIHH